MPLACAPRASSPMLCHPMTLYLTPPIQGGPLPGPWISALVPAPSSEIADFLDARILAKRRATVAKHLDMERRHTSLGFNNHPIRRQTSEAAAPLFLWTGCGPLTAPQPLLTSRRCFA